MCNSSVVNVSSMYRSVSYCSIEYSIISKVVVLYSVVVRVYYV